jgi:hypothetical protein
MRNAPLATTVLKTLNFCLDQVGYGLPVRSELTKHEVKDQLRQVPQAAKTSLVFSDGLWSDTNEERKTRKK